MPTEKLSEARLGEIAVKGAVQLMLEGRFVIGSDSVEGAVMDVVRLGAGREEALQFCEEVVHRAVTRVFADCRREEGNGGAPPTGDDPP